MPRISINDCSLYYERHGAGFPVLMISGLGGLASFWHEQVAALAKRYEVITHDSRGVGESDPIRGGYTVDRMAGDVIALMDRLEIERARICWGIRPAARSRRPWPSSTRSVSRASCCRRAGPSPTPISGACTGCARKSSSDLGPSSYVPATTLFLYPSWWIAKHNEKLRHMEAQNLANFPALEIAMSRIDAILAFDRTAGLPKIKTPTLVVGAEDDVVTPAYFSEELARLIRGAEVKIFPRGGHWFPHVLAREFNQAVLPFLNSHTPAEARERLAEPTP